MLCALLTSTALAVERFNPSPIHGLCVDAGAPGRPASVECVGLTLDQCRKAPFLLEACRRTCRQCKVPPGEPAPEVDEATLERWSTFDGHEALMRKRKRKLYKELGIHRRRWQKSKEFDPAFPMVDAIRDMLIEIVDREPAPPETELSMLVMLAEALWSFDPTDRTCREGRDEGILTLWKELGVRADKVVQQLAHNPPRWIAELEKAVVATGRIFGSLRNVTHGHEGWLDSDLCDYLFAEAEDVMVVAKTVQNLLHSLDAERDWEAEFWPQSDPEHQKDDIFSIDPGDERVRSEAREARYRAFYEQPSRVSAAQEGVPQTLREAARAASGALDSAGRRRSLQESLADHPTLLEKRRKVESRYRRRARLMHPGRLGDDPNDLKDEV